MDISGVVCVYPNKDWKIGTLFVDVRDISELISLASIIMFLLDETEDEDVNREYVEETSRDTVMIAVSQLVATDTVPMVKAICLKFIFVVSLL